MSDAKSAPAKRDASEFGDRVIDLTDMIGSNFGDLINRVRVTRQNKHSRLEQRKASRKNLLAYLKSYGYTHESNGSYYNAVDARGGDFDFDFHLFQDYVCDGLRISHPFDRTEPHYLTWSGDGRRATPDYFLDRLFRRIQAFVDSGRFKKKPTKGSVAVKLYVQSLDFHYDLIPAIRIDGCPDVHLVPYGREHPTAWRLASPARLQRRLSNLNAKFKDIKDCIRIVKYFNGTLRWGLSSFAIVSAVYLHFRNLPEARMEWAMGEAMQVPWKRLLAVLNSILIGFRDGIEDMFGGIASRRQLVPNSFAELYFAILFRAL